MISLDFRRAVRGLTVPALVGLSVLAVDADRAEAATAGTFTFDLYIVADQTAPDAAGMVTTTSVYELDNFNGNFKATTVTRVDDFTYDIGTGLEVESFFRGSNTDGPREGPLIIDQGEIETLTNEYLESEAGTLGDGGDADGRIDFGRNKSVTFDLGDGLTSFYLYDMNAYNDFQLLWCPTATCDISTQLLFSGVANLTALTDTGEFWVGEGGDSSVFDQMLIFNFNTTVTGFLKVVENDLRGREDRPFTGSDRLQADYIGGLSAAPPPQPSEVPLPAGLPLLASGLGLIFWTQRRRAA